MRSSIAKTLYYRLSAVLVFLWLGVVVSVAAVIKYETGEVFDSNLQETAQRILSLAVRELKLIENTDQPARIEPVQHDEYLTYQIFNRWGEMLIRSDSAPLIPFTVPSQIGFYEQDKQHFYVDTIGGGDYWIKLAERRGHRESTLWAITERLLLPLAALLPLVIWLIGLSIKSVRRSINQLDQELSKRSSKDLHPIDLVSLPSELLGLAESANKLMERLKSALEAERNFAANSAHELRTPIASAMSQLDVLREELSDPVSRGRVADARQMIERLEKIATKLLQLARAESGRAFNVSLIDIRHLLDMLLRDQSFRSDRQVLLTSPENSVFILGDLDAVGIVLQNLLENADHYAPPGSPLHIELTNSGGLTVKNDSPAIPKQVLSSFRNRYVRGDQKKSGSGIGLSIVDTILRQCGAELHLESPCFDNGRGFAAHVKFRTSHN